MFAVPTSLRPQHVKLHARTATICCTSKHRGRDHCHLRRGIRSPLANSCQAQPDLPSLLGKSVGEIAWLDVLQFQRNLDPHVPIREPCLAARGSSRPEAFSTFVHVSSTVEAGHPRCTDWKCIAYRLTGSELHFAMIAGVQPLDAWSKRANVAFAHWLNARHGWLGPVFAQRPTVREVAPHDTLDLLAVLHNHADAEHTVEDAVATTRSSHQSYLDPEMSPRWLDVEEGLRRAGFPQQPGLFDEAVRRCGLENRTVSYLPWQSDGNSVRDELTGASVLTIVADELGLSMTALRRRRRRGQSAEAKSIAAHAARAIGVPLAEMANALGITRQRASQLAAVDLTPEHRRVVARIVERLDVLISLSSLR
jgi:hypothetical protein